MENIKRVAIISHNPTTDQGEWVTLPLELKAIWGNISPYILNVEDEIRPILDWLDNQDPDIVWVQGEMTAVAVIWNWCRSRRVEAVVATTNREVEEQQLPDGSVAKKAVFKHCLFRRVPFL